MILNATGRIIAKQRLHEANALLKCEQPASLLIVNVKDHHSPRENQCAKAKPQPVPAGER